MIAQRLAGIGEYYFSQKLREIALLNEAGESVINLGIGSPDLPPHPEVIRVLQEEAAKPEAHAYQGYKGVPALRQAFAEWYAADYGVSLNPDTEILPLMGSKEGIMHICMTYLDAGDVALVPDPGYPTYSSAVKLAGGTPIYYTLSEGLPDLRTLETLDLSSVKLMFINYPHMPTGRTASLTLLSQLVAFAKKHGILLVHDNPYSFILNSQPLSIFQLEGAMEVAMELNSLSKSHNMAGWRIGVLSAKKERIEEILRFKSNMDSGMFLPLQMAAVKALSLGKDWYGQVNNIYTERRKKAEVLMDLLGCTWSSDQTGMFLWGRVPEAYPDGYALSDYILQKSRVFITPGGIFGKQGEPYIRISLCTGLPQFDKAAERIRQAVITHPIRTSL